MASFGEGDAGSDLKWVIGIVLLLGIVWVVMGGPASFISNGKPGNFFSAPTDIIPKKDNSISSKSTAKDSTVSRPSSVSGASSASLNESQYKGQIDVKLGQSYRRTGIVNNEYLILRAGSRNKQAINISGWSIDNGYSQRATDVNSRVTVGQSSIVKIPQGTVLMTGKTASTLGPILLNPGDEAYIITGSLVTKSPYNIDASFKTNKCSGYLGRSAGYGFVPTLSGSCPAYDKELAVSALTDACYKMVRSYGSSCRTPEVTKNQETGKTLVDGREMTSSCRSIIVSTFNYESCLNRHKLDTDFLGKKWYVYLRHQGGLYAADRATITLYDSLGKIVDTYSY